MLDTSVPVNGISIILAFIHPRCEAWPPDSITASRMMVYSSAKLLFWTAANANFAISIVCTSTGLIRDPNDSGKVLCSTS